MEVTAAASSAAATEAALAANRVYAEELETMLETLAVEEKELQQRIQKLRLTRAKRQAARAMAALGCGTPSGASANGGGDSDAHGDANGNSDSSPVGASIFDREPENRYKRVGVVPRSYIRPKPSFFHGPPLKRPRSNTNATNKRRRVATIARNDEHGRHDADDRVDVDPDGAEPAPNADTLVLRQHSHEAFTAAPPKVFSSKERDVVRAFAMAQIRQRDGRVLDSQAINGDDGPLPELPLDVWNQITQTTKPRLHRSGFACKLRWELHDCPGLRLAPWTREEDRALKALATGKVDPSLMNRWHEIARRMPVGGRPAVHCLIRYQTKLNASVVNDKFTHEEDELLRQAVAVFGERWATIADLMDGRIAEQLRHRWQMSLSPNVRQGKFSVVEDRRLLLALYAYHHGEMEAQEGIRWLREQVNWHDICHHVPGRPSPPVRDRFVDSLNPAVRVRAWTTREDALIKREVLTCGFDAQALWPRLASELGNRTDNQVARRARTLLATEYNQHLDYQRQHAFKATRSATFQRPSAPKRRVNPKLPHELRSSYNAKSVDEAEDAVEQQEEEGEGEEEEQEIEADNSSVGEQGIQIGESVCI